MRERIFPHTLPHKDSMSNLCDSYSETNQNDLLAIARIHPTSQGVGYESGQSQSFTGDGNPIESVKFYLKKVGTPGNLIARVYAHSGTFGTSSVPTGSALDSSSPVAGSSLDTSLGLIEFTGFSGYTTVNGTKYCTVVEALDGTWNDSNYVLVGIDTSSPTHGGNEARYYSSAWHAESGMDLCFYVYTTVTTTAKTSSDTGSGVDVKVDYPAVSHSRSEAGSGVDSKSNYPSAIQTGVDSGLGSEVGYVLEFMKSSSDNGIGVEAVALLEKRASALTPLPNYRLEVHNENGDLLAFLDKAFAINIEDIYNQLGVLTFSLAVDDLKYSHLAHPNEVWVYNNDSFFNAYKMKLFDDTHDIDKKIIEIKCFQVGDRLNDDIVENYDDIDTVSNHLTVLLALQHSGNGEITLGGVDSALNLTRQLKVDGITIWESVLKLRDTVGGIACIVCDPDNPTTRALWIKEAIGEDKGQQIRYSKNLASIKRSRDYTSYATKLYPRGNSGLQLDDSPFTETPEKSSDATYGYLNLPYLSCYKNWTVAGDALPAGMSITATGEAAEYKFPASLGATTGWTNPSYAFDNNLATYAISDDIAFNIWSNVIEFYLDLQRNVDKIKLYFVAGGGTYQQWYVKLELYYIGSWHTYGTKSGEIPFNTWYEWTCTTQGVSAYRLSFLNAVYPGDNPYKATLYETQYYSNGIFHQAYCKQGANENVIREQIDAYLPDCTYQITYTHATYLRNVDASDIICRKYDYLTDDINTLRGLAVEEFSTLSEPYTTYTINVVDLSNGLPFEFLYLGSLVQVIDEELAIIIQTRIVRISRDLDAPHIEIDLSNKVKNLMDTIVKLLN